jgi:hypothetical protein
MGDVELEPEIDEWIDALDEDEQATVAFYIDLLAERGPLLGEPYTRRLVGKLRELRFHLDRQAVRDHLLDCPPERRIILFDPQAANAGAGGDTTGSARDGAVHRRGTYGG